MSMLRVPEPEVDDQCFRCGAADGDFDDFVGRYAVLCLCEPTDQLRSLERGYQMLCSICKVAELPIADGEILTKTWLLTITTQRFGLRFAR